jgi:NAD(P)-dependent dehydrogenase (short-subunit alcohol dehydrogenase family)
LPDRFRRLPTRFPRRPSSIETVKQIRGYGRRGEGIKADIRDIAALRSIADQVESRYCKIDIVVADAGIQRWKPLLEMEDSDWRDVIDINLNGPEHGACLRA